MDHGQNGGVTAVIAERARESSRDLGDTFMNAFNDPKTIEIMLNADGSSGRSGWARRQCNASARCGRAQAQAIIKTIAGFHGKEVTRKKPILEGELPLDGSRFAGQLPPIVSSPTFAHPKEGVSPSSPSATMSSPGS